MPAMTHRERRLFQLLAGVVTVAVVGIGVIQIRGGVMGGPCADSYSCRGFLIGGAECVADGAAGSYCTRYCKSDASCPRGWRCRDAHPSVLTIETRATGGVCIRD